MPGFDGDSSNLCVSTAAQMHTFGFVVPVLRYQVEACLQEKSQEFPTLVSEKGLFPATVLQTGLFKIHPMPDGGFPCVRARRVMDWDWGSSHLTIPLQEALMSKRTEGTGATLYR